MNESPTDRLEDFVAAAVEQGRYGSASEVARARICLLEIRVTPLTQKVKEARKAQEK